ncbi:cytochrome b5-like [Hordeum vulgare subsp. vulgare]|uniref:cytochrome b5-like n=1 Tax=Hordeum vulgare subsp. vulgare TaxID=112509 RepID=UPI000295E018|nr:cytochrome b5-like [Hordeum vulgare subsp. vulgare]KAI4980826.1 hypothetical protein ZWY2020_021311 [Hordeum vulgare]
MEGGGKVYSFQEVRKHSERQDCWLIISGKVYDVTPYMEEHPGGDEVLLACTGKDATADFDDIGHSDAAKELMRQYCVGEVDAATVPAKLGCAVLPAKGAADPAPRASTGQLLQLALPLLLVAMAFALQTFAKTKTETD